MLRFATRTCPPPEDRHHHAAHLSARTALKHIPHTFLVFDTLCTALIQSCCVQHCDRSSEIAVVIWWQKNTHPLPMRNGHNCMYSSCCDVFIWARFRSNYRLEAQQLFEPGNPFRTCGHPYFVRVWNLVRPVRKKHVARRCHEPHSTPAGGHSSPTAQQRLPKKI